MAVNSRILMFCFLVSILSPSYASLSTSDMWLKFGEMIKVLLEAKTCAANVNQITDAVAWCWESFDDDVSNFNKHELNQFVGCCIKGKFDYCIKYKIDSVCPGITANVTESAISYLKVFQYSLCPDNVHPEYPTIECDAILMPAQTWIGIMGLIVAVTIFSAFIAVLVFLILMISRRLRSRDHYMAI